MWCVLFFEVYVRVMAEADFCSKGASLGAAVLSIKYHGTGSGV